MHLAEPGWLVLLLLVPLPWWYQRLRPRIAWPSLDSFAGQGRAGSAGWDGCRLCSAGWPSRPWPWRSHGRSRWGGRTRIASRGVAIVVVL